MGSGGGGGSGGSSGTSIQFIEILPFRTGLRAVLASVNLTRLLLHNDFVFINRYGHVGMHTCLRRGASKDCRRFRREARDYRRVRGLRVPIWWMRSH